MINRKWKPARDVVVIGGAMSQFGVFPEKTSRDLMADEYTAALETIDKRLDPRDIDALYIRNFTADLFERQSHLGHLIADWLGLTPRPATRVEGACASSGLAFREEMMAVAQLQEVWHQLRGSAGDRQIAHKDLRLGLTHNVGGTGGTCVIHILERV